MSQIPDALERIFHEPNRFSIMSELCAVGNGVTFSELKDRCSLTDGNLSRHLTALEKEGAISIVKEFVENKPRTTVSLTKKGRAHFLSYLDALATVLKATAERVKPSKEDQSLLFSLSKLKLAKP